MQDEDLIIKANRVLVCSDLHIPRHSIASIERMRQTAIQQRTRTLLIIGDIYDWPQFSSYPKIDESSMAAEIELGKRLFNGLFKTFSEIICCSGNHDRRLSQTLGYSELSFRDLMALTDPRIMATNNSWMTLVSAKKEFLCVHPDKYSAIPGKIANGLANRHNTHVLSAHSHNAAITVSNNGQHIAVDLGCMCDPTKAKYKTSSKNMFPEWTNAYATVIDGKARLYVNGLTG